MAGSGETEIVLDSIYITEAADPVYISGRASSFAWRSRRLIIPFNTGGVTSPSARALFAPALKVKGSAGLPAFFKPPVKVKTAESPVVPYNSRLEEVKDTLLSHDFPLLFTARLDTIFHLDTISIRYDYPENLFTFSLHPRPDSVLFKQIVVRPKAEA